MYMIPKHTKDCFDTDSFNIICLFDMDFSLTLSSRFCIRR